MKILIVYFSQVIQYDNLYVKSLYEEMRRQGFQATCSIDNFWDLAQHYDIIHIQFPEVIFKWRTPSQQDLAKLNRCIEARKRQGSKIIYTRHNRVPHYCSEPTKLELYQIIEGACDGIIHLGEYSRQEFLATHPQSQARHTIIPHHIYNHSGYNMPSRETARRHLQLPLDRFVILTFGAYRNPEERTLITHAFRQLPIGNKYLLAPGFYNDCFKNRKTPISNRLKYYRQKKEFHMPESEGKLLHRKLNNSELPDYFAAADMVLIQRKTILNSGNVPMAFFFHRVVAGSMQGNVGQLLQQTGNPTFDLADSASVVQAILQAKELTQADYGEKNAQFAQQHMRVELVAQSTVSYYQQLLNH